MKARVNYNLSFNLFFMLYLYICNMLKCENKKKQKQNKTNNKQNKNNKKSKQNRFSPVTVVKQLLARSVFGWVTAWEHRVLKIHIFFVFTFVFTFFKNLLI